MMAESIPSFGVIWLCGAVVWRRSDQADHRTPDRFALGHCGQSLGHVGEVDDLRRCRSEGTVVEHFKEFARGLCEHRRHQRRWISAERRADQRDIGYVEMRIDRLETTRVATENM